MTMISDNQVVLSNFKGNDIECLLLSKELVTMLKSVFCIRTIGELLSIPCKQLYYAIEVGDFGSNHKENSNYYKRELSRNVHIIGAVLKDEYKEIGLDEQMALTKIDNLNLPTVIKNSLRRHADIHTLGELLTCDYIELRRTPNIGETYLQMLKDCVHSLGYQLLNEELSIDEKKRIIQEKKQILLEEFGIPISICNILYKNGIFTIQDLKKIGPAVFSLSGLGPAKQQALIKAMESLGIKIEFNAFSEEQHINDEPMTNLIQRINSENQVIQERIQKKEGLLDQYQKVMNERKQLIEKEQELDRLIKEMYDMRARGFQNVKKRDYTEANEN